MTRCVVAIWDVSLTWGTQDVPFCAFLFLFCHQHAFSCWAALVCMSALSFADVSNDIGLKMPFHWLSGNCNCPYWKKLIPAQVFNALYDRFRQVLKDISAEGVTSYSDLTKIPRRRICDFWLWNKTDVIWKQSGYNILTFDVKSQKSWTSYKDLETLNLTRKWQQCCPTFGEWRENLWWLHDVSVMELWMSSWCSVKQSVCCATTTITTD